MGPGRWGSRGRHQAGRERHLRGHQQHRHADRDRPPHAATTCRTCPSAPISSRTWSRPRSVTCPCIPMTTTWPSTRTSCWAAHNLLAELLPEFADLADCVRVIDVPAVTGGQVLRVYLNADLDEAVALLDDGGGSGPPRPDRPARRITNRSSSGAGVSAWPNGWSGPWTRPRFGVEAVYLYGSVKNGTAGPRERHRPAGPLPRRRKPDANCWTMVRAAGARPWRR